MKKILFLTLLILLACGQSRPAITPTLPAPTQTPDTRLGGVTSLMWHFEHEYQFKCAVNRDHWRCMAPDGLVKIVLFNDPVTEAFISVPLEAAGSKPSKYVVDFLFQTGLGTPAWDWLVSKMKEPESSRVFGDRRLTSQIDSEGWLVTVTLTP